MTASAADVDPPQPPPARHPQAVVLKPQPANCTRLCCCCWCCKGVCFAVLNLCIGAGCCWVQLCLPAAADVWVELQGSSRALLGRWCCCWGVSTPTPAIVAHQQSTGDSPCGTRHHQLNAVFSGHSQPTCCMCIRFCSSQRMRPGSRIWYPRAHLNHPKVVQCCCQNQSA